MAYIGRNPAIGTQKVLDSLESQFNGTLTTFNLRYNNNTIYPPIASALIVSLGGVLQEPGTAYDVSSDQIVFATAPPTGTDCWILLYSEFGGQAGATANLAVSNNLTIGSGGEIRGPSTFVIDPAAVGDNTGTVEIKGNLTVQGTQTIINSTTVDLDHLALGDNERFTIGAGGTGDNNVVGKDLEIYSNGSNLYFDSPYIYTGDGASVSPNIYFRTSKTTTLDTDALTILNTGRIGIGAYNNTSYDQNAQDVLIASDGNTGITIRSAGSTPFAMIHFADGTNGQAQQRAGRIMYQHDGDNLTFHTANAEKLRISGTGTVSITGSVANMEYLRMGGNNDRGLRFTSSSGSSSVGVVHTINAPGDGGNQGEIVLQTNSANRLRITSAGKVSINNDNALSDLHVCTAGSSEQDGTFRIGGNGSGVGLVLDYDQSGSTLSRIMANDSYTNSSALLKISVDGDLNTNQLVLKGDGKIGVGTDNPSRNLSVYDASNAGVEIKTGTSGQSSVFFTDTADGNIGMIGYYHTDDSMFFRINDAERLLIDSSGHITPGADDTQDFGSASKRWRNIYTGDLQLSNEGSSNDVDGTWGKYTIQEGEEELFIINRRTGKKFKFVLEEVN